MNSLVYLPVKQRKKVIAQVVDSGMYSVMADTTSDVCHKDRLSVCVRYKDSLGEISKWLLEECEGNDKTGLGIVEKIHGLKKKMGFRFKILYFNHMILPAVCQVR
jgi:hypothetical protein